MSESPTFFARFKLDQEGRPKFIKSTRSDHLHYEITLHVAATPDVDSVTYRLDPTYYDPLREVSRGSEEADDFEEAITSYGDYEIEVGASGSRRRPPMRIRQKLSDALRRGHQDDLLNPAVAEAIELLEGS